MLLEAVDLCQDRVILLVTNTSVGCSGAANSAAGQTHSTGVSSQKAKHFGACLKSSYLVEELRLFFFFSSPLILKIFFCKTFQTDSLRAEVLLMNKIKGPH